MSRENVELYYRSVDAFNRRDWDAFRSLFDEEVEVESRLVAMEGGYHGHAGLRRWWDDFLGAFPDYTIEVEELRDLGDVTLSHLRGWDVALTARRQSSIRHGNQCAGGTERSPGGATARPRRKPSKPSGCASRLGGSPAGAISSAGVGAGADR